MFSFQLIFIRCCVLGEKKAKKFSGVILLIILEVVELNCITLFYAYDFVIEKSLVNVKPRVSLI